MTSSKPGETPTLTCVCCFRKCPWRKPWTDTSFQRFPSKARATGRCSADVPSLCTSVLVCSSSKMTHARHSSTTTDDACRFFFSVSDFRSPFSKTEGFRQSCVVDFVFVWMSLDGSVGTCRRIVSFTMCLFWRRSPWKPNQNQTFTGKKFAVYSLQRKSR